MTDNANSHCENCGQPIGKLELPHTWGDANVCWDCYKKLTEQNRARVAADAPAPAIPTYRMLRFLADCLWYLGWAALIGGIPLCIVAMLIMSVTANRSSVGVALAVLINCVLWGFSSLATAQFLHCIQDIARNSWVLTQK